MDEKYEVITDATEVERALKIWRELLCNSEDSEIVSREIGFKGGREKREIILLPKHKCWAYIGSWNNRHWCAYGYAPAEVGDHLNITLEINPLIEGTRNFRGRILRRPGIKDRMLLAHTGGKGGGGARQVSVGEF